MFVKDSVENADTSRITNVCSISLLGLLFITVIIY